MKPVRLLALAAAVVTAAGCSTYSVPRYSNYVDNVTALRSLRGSQIAVGDFTATKPGIREITCRAVGPIKTPDGSSFEEYIRSAFIAELKLAEVYSSAAPVTLTGNLDAIDFSSTDGVWNLQLTMKSSNGKSISVQEEHKYTTNFIGETACNQTAQALVPAVQTLIGKVVSSPEFSALIQ